MSKDNRLKQTKDRIFSRRRFLQRTQELASVGMALGFTAVSTSGCLEPRKKDSHGESKEDSSLPKESLAEWKKGEKEFPREILFREGRDSDSFSHKDTFSDKLASEKFERELHLESTFEQSFVAPDGRAHVVIELDKHPKMKIIGWYIDINLPSDKVLLFRKGHHELKTFSIICSHKQCLVGWRSDKGYFVCPCHKAEFNAEGIVIGGPAPKPLKQYQTSYDAKENKAYVFLD